MCEGEEGVKYDSWVTGVNTWVVSGQRQRTLEKDILWGKIRESNFKHIKFECLGDI